jgi:hypothetical protein
MQKVFVIQAMGVRQAGLIARVERAGRIRLKVHVQGALRATMVDPCLVFIEAEAARQAWRAARAHRERIEKAGRHMTVVDAALDLASRRQAA